MKYLLPVISLKAEIKGGREREEEVEPSPGGKRWPSSTRQREKSASLALPTR
jgi:hypothetical protein